MSIEQNQMPLSIELNGQKPEKPSWIFAAGAILFLILAFVLSESVRQTFSSEK